jgi:hypothetical protein
MIKGQWMLYFLERKEEKTFHAQIIIIKQLWSSFCGWIDHICIRNVGPWEL